MVNSVGVKEAMFIVFCPLWSGPLLSEHDYRQ